MTVSLVQAQAMIEVVLQKAHERRVNVSVSVVDAGGLPVATARMDNAVPLSIQVADAKALGSALWRRDGDLIEKGAADRPDMFAQINELPLLRLPLMPSDGSRVLIRDGVLHGAIGVSGGPAEIDRACADAAADLFEGM